MNNERLKKIWDIAVIILLNLMLLCVAGDESARRLFRVSEYAYSALGDRSDEVERVQWQLKGLGYFDGEPDGFFGIITRSALKNFQTNTGLKPTGKADEETLEALKIRTVNPSCLGDTDYELLTRFAAAQCAGDSVYGKMSEIEMLLGAARSQTAPESIAAVLFQQGRYPCVEHSMLEKEPNEECRLAVYLLCG